MSVLTSSKNWIPNVHPAISKLSPIGHAGFRSRDVEEVWKHIFIPRGHLKTRWVELHQHIDACKHIELLLLPQHITYWRPNIAERFSSFSKCRPSPGQDVPDSSILKIFVEEDFQIMFFHQVRQQSPLSPSLPWHGISSNPRLLTFPESLCSSVSQSVPKTGSHS